MALLSDIRSSTGIQRGMLVAGLVLTTLVVLTALFAPLIAPYSWGQTSGANGSFGTQQPPSSEHIWGTTVSGFDVFSRVVWGSRTAVAVILAAVTLSLFAGVALGLVSGYVGGWLDRISVVVADAIYAFPSLLLAIVMSIALTGGRSSAIGGIAAAAISILSLIHI